MTRIFVQTIIRWRLAFDPDKRMRTLIVRGLDMARANEVFAGPHQIFEDERHPEELRYITVGWLDGRMIVMVWTQRGDARRIISMRKANEREKARYGGNLDRPR